MKKQIIFIPLVVVLVSLLFFNGKAVNDLQKRNVIQTREYQFDVDMEGYYIYSGETYLGFVPFETSPVLDSIIIADNE